MAGKVFSIERYAVHDGDGIRTIVYLKGCPLRCLWCANPEGQEERSQLFFFPDRCIGCGRCVDVCSFGAAHRDENGRIEHDPSRCRGCGNCVDICNTVARQLFGRSMEVDEVVAEVLKDRPFYRRSSGGVTVSGGEPSMQPEFTAELLRECRVNGIHTAIETCGYTSWGNLATIADHLDLVLYDIKHMDLEEHLRLTGVPNGLILENLLRLSARGLPIIVRVPVIPGYNDSPHNLETLATFLEKLPSLGGVNLLPYHNYGSGKYAWCGREYLLADLTLPDMARMEALARIFTARGIHCEVQ